MKSIKQNITTTYDEVESLIEAFETFRVNSESAKSSHIDFVTMLLDEYVPEYYTELKTLSNIQDENRRYFEVMRIFNFLLQQLKTIYKSTKANDGAYMLFNVKCKSIFNKKLSTVLNEAYSTTVSSVGIHLIKT